MNAKKKISNCNSMIDEHRKKIMSIDKKLNSVP